MAIKNSDCVIIIKKNVIKEQMFAKASCNCSDK